MLIDQYVVAKIKAGSDVGSFVDRKSVISIVKKQSGAAKGLLKGSPVNLDISDKASIVIAITE